MWTKRLDCVSVCEWLAVSAAERKGPGRGVGREVREVRESGSGYQCMPEEVVSDIILIFRELGDLNFWVGFLLIVSNASMETAFLVGSVAVLFVCFFFF
jgi:hypothetical protein